MGVKICADLAEEDCAGSWIGAGEDDQEPAVHMQPCMGGCRQLWTIPRTRRPQLNVYIRMLRFKHQIVHITPRQRIGDSYQQAV
jgi:hypothetical protein